MGTDRHHLPATRLGGAPCLVFLLGSLLLVSATWIVTVQPRAEAADAGIEQTIYRYVNQAGRTVFVNGISRVPPTYRARARPVDLSHVSLNRKVSSDLEREIARVHQKMIASSYCARARGSAAEGFFGRLWREHAALLAAVALLLLAISPWMMRAIDPPVWLRLLSWVLPLLLAIGLLTRAAVSSRQAMRQVEADAELCQPLDNEASPAERVTVIRNLRLKMEAAYKARAAAIDRQLK